MKLKDLWPFIALSVAWKVCMLAGRMINAESPGHAEYVQCVRDLNKTNNVEVLEGIAGAIKKGLSREELAGARLLLGMHYLFGRGCEKAPEKARRYLEAAAREGECTAEYCLGVLHAKGIGTQTNLVEAANWYEKAAKQGHAKARERLAALKRMSAPEGARKE